MFRGFGSYCDEFGHPKDPNKHFMGIAGLLAWSKDWAQLSCQWQELQRSESIPNPFHMVDFIHRKKDFTGRRWESTDERKRVLRLLLDLLKPVDVVPVSAAVSLRDFNGLSKEQQTRLVSPYHIAFQEVTFNLASAAANRALQSVRRSEEFFGNQTAMVYSKLKKITGPAQELWNAIKEHNPGAGHWMGSYTVGEPADFPPLQAADIWAYTIGHMQEKQKAAKSEAQISFSFFLNATFRAQGLGHNHFTFFDRKEMLLRLGELP